MLSLSSNCFHSFILQQHTLCGGSWKRSTQRQCQFLKMFSARKWCVTEIVKRGFISCSNHIIVSVFCFFLLSWFEHWFIIEKPLKVCPFLWLINKPHFSSIIYLLCAPSCAMTIWQFSGISRMSWLTFIYFLLKLRPRNVVLLTFDSLVLC